MIGAIDEFRCRCLMYRQYGGERINVESAILDARKSEFELS